MVALDILPRKTFELTLADGSKVHGQFGTWSASRFGEKKKLPLSQIFEYFSGDKYTLQDMIDYVLCAIEYKERQNKQPAGRFTDVDLCLWMDQYMDDTGEDGILLKLFNLSGSEDTTDKKKQESQLNGESYKESSTQQVAV